MGINAHKIKTYYSFLRHFAGNEEYVALHMVSSETLFWETMEQLKALGANSILVMPIEKMME